MLPPQHCIMFDLDGTLAPSKAAIPGSMALLLKGLLTERIVAVISGGALSQYEKQLLGYMDPESNFEHLILLPASGSALHSYKNGWTCVYKELLSESERTKIKNAIHQVLPLLHINAPEKTYGEQIDDRESQVSFSWLGQEAPIEAKKLWDPAAEKRKQIVEALAPLLPEYHLGIGGMTTIDITKKGIDKEYGIKKTADYLGVGLDDILYVGDALFVGGNDYPAIKAGVATIQVSDEKETEALISSWLASPSQI